MVVLNSKLWQAHARGGSGLGERSDVRVLRVAAVLACENLFAPGEIRNTTGNNMTAGTHGSGYQSYVAAEGIKLCLASPGLLS